MTTANAPTGFTGAALAQRYGTSSSNITVTWQRGELPAPDRIHARATFWPLERILEFEKTAQYKRLMQRWARRRELRARRAALPEILL
jgi:hypothetical protein